ncbi:MAG: site-2 protease family protein [Clostridia bacterium]|nr:site-2 protease family protein [Clostridia bacterium]
MYLLQLLISALTAMIAIVVHEFSHGYVAYLMGDYSAKQDGRLSFNPLRHLDFVGVICLIFFKIGWAKPVPVNPYMFKNRKKGIVYVSLAGVVSNFILAVFSIIFMCFLYNQNTLYVQILYLFFYNLAAVNIGLGVFNLIPIPPLDGSKVLAQLLPMQTRIKYLNFERYGGLLLFVLIYFGNLSRYLNIALTYIFQLLFNIIAGVIL